jgi:hypothetical protein
MTWLIEGLRLKNGKQATDNKDWWPITSDQSRSQVQSGLPADSLFALRGAHLSDQPKSGSRTPGRVAG